MKFVRIYSAMINIASTTNTTLLRTYSANNIKYKVRRTEGRKTHRKFLFPPLTPPSGDLGAKCGCWIAQEGREGEEKSSLRSADASELSLFQDSLCLWAMNILSFSYGLQAPPFIRTLNSRFVRGVTNPPSHNIF